MTEISGKTVLVTGGNRGIGQALVEEALLRGAHRVHVSTRGSWTHTDERVTPVVFDVTDPAAIRAAASTVESLDLLVNNAGIALYDDLTDRSADVKIAFGWLKAALLAPLLPGSRVVVISSGAAIFGSPASGGYAGAKATQRFIAAYAAEESQRAGLDITVTAVLPAMTPFGDVGKAGIRAYTARTGKTEDEYLVGMGEPLTPELAGSALVDLVLADPGTVAPGYLLTPGGLRSLPAPGQPLP